MHAVHLLTGCTKFYNQTRSQSGNEINTHTEHLVQKLIMICFNWKEAFWSLTKKKTRKQERKANRIITLDGKNSNRRSNYNNDLRKLRVNKIIGRRNHKAALNEKPSDSPQYSSFAVQFSIPVAKTRAILLFKIKITLIEMFELNERMPGMRSAEYQATIPLKFFIIMHNYANV